MNTLLWSLQVLLALHTAMGALWKFFNPSQSVDALQGLPHGAWIAMSIVEILCAVALLLPAVSKRLGILVPIAAGLIGVEMLLFCALALKSGGEVYGEIIYWLVVAAVCAFLAYGRLVLKPLR